SMTEHPRIGDRASRTGMSAAEQSGAAAASDEVRRGLAEGNVAYEMRFGHIFLICASGLSGQEMLTELRARLGNDQDAERAVVRAELLKITRLRMTKWLGL
ncbi:MAG TPA: 2-oxo-4-hydroxy-4-carboxy-5-ureidoimidazoline decarboxylase, partial [Streptosporangiaceae bacterium]|nr:2-oxo-4-hydroxy-4-carboxy-5-ureidoimidazoline decarboxylase [Streptosporangiaceae bacterium]